MPGGRSARSLSHLPKPLSSAGSWAMQELSVSS